MCILQIFHLRKKCYELKYAVAHCRVDTPFGSSASREEMKTFDDTCPICQDIFTDAVKLSCKVSIGGAFMALISIGEPIQLG